MIDVVIDLHEKCSSQANGPVGMRNVYFDGKSNIEIAHHDDTHQMFQIVCAVSLPREDAGMQSSTVFPTRDRIPPKRPSYGINSSLFVSPIVLASSFTAT